MEHLKKNELTPFAVTQVDLEISIPSEVSQKKVPYDNALYGI